MESTDREKKWAEEISSEIKKMEGVLEPAGFEIDDEQPHISGERFLMTRNKLVLAGRRAKDNMKVIIKVSSHPEGQSEIRQEKLARDLLSSLSFSKDTILFPREIYFNMVGPYLIWASEFIAQEKVFVAHSIEEQFFTILRIFEAQEAFHATTQEHLAVVRKIFKIFKAEEYIKEFILYKKMVLEFYPDEEMQKTLEQAESMLRVNKEKINNYCNYLTHTDLVPHNFRIKNRIIYMLDCSSIYFGNKYEGWARFLNYMVIHNPELEQLLREYVYRNRGEDEYLNLRLMRIYKTGFLMKYYAESLGKTDGDLYKLTLTRLKFWHQVMKSVIEDGPINKEVLSRYIESRDILRSEEEKKRQKEFAVA